MPTEQDLVEMWTQWRDEHVLAHHLYLVLRESVVNGDISPLLADDAMLAIANYEKVHGVAVPR